MKWVRSKDGVFAGVCKGVSQTMDLNVGWVRLIWVIAVLFCGVGILPYLLLWIALPREDRLEVAYKPKVFGVCLRISKRTELEVGIVRFLCLLLAIASLGATVVGYIVLHFVLEEKTSVI